MNSPSPALVAQSAVRRLPRWALLLLCIAYILPGFIERTPWKGADITAFGIMEQLAGDPIGSAWMAPAFMDHIDLALLPYWIGALTLRVTDGWLAPDLAVRLPFIVMLALTFLAVWSAVSNLSKHANAQPVAFAFGGEADPRGYAWALADSALLALVATLGLAQISHEATPTAARLFFIATLFYGLAAVPFKPGFALPAAGLGLIGLALSGSSGVALVIGVLVTIGLLRLHPNQMLANRRIAAFLVMLVATLICVWIEWQLGWWRDNLAFPVRWVTWRDRIKLFIWFTWPVWPLAIWTLWRWWRQALAPRYNWHISLPVMLTCIPLISAIISGPPDRGLLLALPGLSALAAFALPTFKRSAAAFIDWFTVLFFTGWAIFIWVMWIATQTGFPPQPAANVERLAPGFKLPWQWQSFLIALAGTLVWAWIVYWRTSRHRDALWKSLVLPACGTTLCWLLFMTLWLPALDYARSYATQIERVREVIGLGEPCVNIRGLTNPEITAMRFHGGWSLVQFPSQQICPWLVSSSGRKSAFETSLQGQPWQLVAEIAHPVAKQDVFVIFKRKSLAIESTEKPDIETSQPK